MGRVRRTNCRLCMKQTNRGESTIINNLPKTFAHMLEEMSGIRFTQADGLQISVCLRCRDFLQAMENHSQYPMSNKISGSGKRKVRRLMDKGFSAAEAIEKVLAEKRARTLLAGTAGSNPGRGGDNVALPIQQIKNVALGVGAEVGGERRRLSGAQRKKVQILIAGGVDRATARELVWAASQAAAASGQNVSPGRADRAQRQGNQRRPVPPNNASQNGNIRRRSPQKPTSSRSGLRETSSQRLGTQKVGAAKGLAQKALSLKKAAIRSGNGLGQRASSSRIRTRRNPSGTQRAGTDIADQRAPKSNGQRNAGSNHRVASATNNSSGSRSAPAAQRANQSSSQRAPSGSQKAAAPAGRLIQKAQAVAPSKQKRAADNVRVGGGGSGGRNSNSDVRTSSNSRRKERPAPYDSRGSSSRKQRENRNFDSKQNSMDVGIVPINYPQARLDDMKLDALKEAITNEILKIPQGGPSVRFLGTSYQDGWLKLICADRLSYDWLSALVLRWERAGIRLLDADSIPGSDCVLSFYLSGDFRSPEEILNILERQNNSLNTGLWRILDRKTDNNGQSITVCVDELSYQSLRNRDFQVFLGLGMIDLKPRHSSNDKGSFKGQLNLSGGMGGRSNFDMGRNSSQNYSNNHNGGGNNISHGRGGGGGGGGMGNNNSGNGGGGGGYYRQGYQTTRYQSQRSW